MKPRITTKCPANRHARPDERIIEFSGDNINQGSLIALHTTPDGRLIVDIYRQGAKVEVRIGKPDEQIN